MYKLIILTVWLVTAQFALAHGENTLGPNGGLIRMPSNFHTEVLPDADGSFHVYLLDIQFQNPSVKDSTLEAKIVKGKKSQKLDCMVMDQNHFHCTGAKAKAKGELILLAKREGVTGVEAVYKLPIKLPQVNTQKNEATKAVDPHAGHH